MKGEDADCTNPASNSDTYGSAENYYLPFTESTHVQAYYPPLRSAPFYCLPKCRDKYRDEYINRRIMTFDTVSYGQLTQQQREGIAYYESILWQRWSGIDSAARLFTMGAAIANARKVTNVKFKECLTDIRGKLLPLARASAVRAFFLYPLGVAFGFTFGHNLSERQVAGMYYRDPVMRELLEQRVEYEKRKRELILELDREIEAEERQKPANERSSMYSKAVKAVDEANAILKKEYFEKRAQMTGDVDTARGLMKGGWDAGSADEEAEKEKRLSMAEARRFAWSRDSDSSVTKQSDPVPPPQDTGSELLDDLINQKPKDPDAIPLSNKLDVLNAKASGGSAWDRIRQQAGQGTRSESSWSKNRKKKHEESGEYDSGESEREKAQREFEANLERERRIAAGEGRDDSGWKN